MEIREETREWLKQYCGRRRPRESVGQTSIISVRSVWSSNVECEFHLISKAVKEGKYNQATLDTEFVLAMNMKNTSEKHPRFASPEERYHNIRMKTDNGIIRQLGLTLSADDGSVLIWEFNFVPDLFVPLYSLEEIEEYFRTTQLEPIDPIYFSNLLRTSGLVYNNNITWIMFHSAYDLAFFIKLATFWSPLPDALVDFSSLVRTYLGEIILDVKYIIKFTHNLHGGLEEVATALGIERVVGHAHQAGSDSLLTWHTYKRMKDIHFPLDGGVRHAGILYGIHDI
ncbi:hypothetical protein LUZ62_086772 [Rhynchospora pubera]|uniref:Uncharacterized protein n=1 Tax=Rhynchospora pubera TaxID=906938 RepID=A0AAV8CCY6_9POAL|nr:hypothetical protein LUZ62_086772 [Rhynchospora pubera]